MNTNRVAYLIVKTPFMPNEAWESTVHLYGYWPLRRKVTRRVADWPCEICLVVRPLMLKSCAVAPRFVTLKITMPRFAAFALRMNLKSLAVTLIVFTSAAL